MPDDDVRRVDFGSQPDQHFDAYCHEHGWQAQASSWPTARQELLEHFLGEHDAGIIEREDSDA